MRSVLKRCFSSSLSVRGRELAIADLLDSPAVTEVSVKSRNLPSERPNSPVESTSSSVCPDASYGIDPYWPPDPDAIFASRDQILYPAGPEEIEVLSRSPVQYADPHYAPNSVIVRITSLSAAVTSPVLRVVRNRQFGARGDESLEILGIGWCVSFLMASLGFWQLRRMEFKRLSIERRRDRLAQGKLILTGSPFPWSHWSTTPAEWEFRQVEVSGVLDTSREMLIGPRSMRFASDGGPAAIGYQIICPLILQDGSQILVNRGSLPLDCMDKPRNVQKVKIRGVLVSGELAGGKEWWRLPNKPADNKFVYAVVEDLAEGAQISTNFDEARLLMLNALEVVGMQKQPKFIMKKFDDYLAFYGDEHTHFWYAIQWFSCAAVLAGMTCYRYLFFFRKYRW